MIPFRIVPLLVVPSLLAAPPSAAGMPAPTAIPAEASAGDALDRPFGAATPAELLSAAASAPAPADAGAVVLLEEGHYSYDAEGRATLRYRLVAKILTADAADWWGDVEAGWAPWHQDRPTVAARVISADGTEHRLEPRTLSEAPAGDPSSGVFSDRRLLRGPLPALGVGSVVDQEIVTRDREPVLPGCAGGVFWFGGSATRKVRLRLDAPKSLPLRWKLRELPGVVPARVEKDGRVEVVVEAGPFESSEPLEPNLPPDLARRGSVLFSTGRDWQDLASRYSAIVDQRLREVDLRSTAKNAVRGASGREAVAQRLLEFVRKGVRYEALELGQGSVVPRNPADVLRRKYGDCKDQATLLVGLLRQVGIPASVALLRAGPGTDVDPDLPQLSSFDHVIVVVHGSPEIWIDPTDGWSRAGEPPPADQGRFALPANGVTSALVRIPSLPAERNVLTEIREVFLSERGPARVVETTETAGIRDQQYRSMFSAGAAAAKKQLEPYAKEAWRAEKLDGVEVSKADDPSIPFRLKLEISKASRAFTDEANAVVGVFPVGLTGQLPAWLRATGDEEDEGEEATKPRKSPMELDYPFVTRWVYRITPPPGYAPREIPHSSERRFGPALLRTSWMVEGGRLVGDLSFSTGPRRWTAEEVEAFRAEYRKAAEEDALLVTFSSVAGAELDAGRFAPAVAELRRLAALHPKEALHRSALAKALLRAGLGDAARAEARRGTTLEPESAAAWKALAEVLAHDRLGRLHAKGWDRAASTAAFERASRLDPEDDALRASLVGALLLGDDGEPFGPGADLVAAVARIRELEKAHASDSLRQQRIACQMQLGQWLDVESGARELEDRGMRAAMTLVAASRLRGIDAALSEAKSVSPDPEERRAALALGSGDLVRLRDYAGAAAFLTEASVGNPSGAELRSRAELLRGLRRWEDVLAPESEPKGVAQRFLAAALVGREADAAALLSSTSDRHGILGEYLRALAGQALGEVKRRSGNSIPRELLADSSVAGARVTVEGSEATGWKVRFRLAEAGTIPIFLVPEGGRPRVLTVERDLRSLGAEALRRLDAGDLPAARKWLDRARDTGWSGTGDDPLSGDPVARLWPKDTELGLAEARLAAAAATTEGRLARPGVPADPERAEQLRRAIEILAPAEAGPALVALAQAYEGDTEAGRLLAVADQLVARFPSSPTAFRLRQQALARLRRWDDCAAAAAKRWAADPEDGAAGRWVMRAAIARGRLEEAETITRALIESADEVSSQNELAWLMVFREPLPAEALDAARRAARESRAYSSLHTLATACAEAGEIGEAIESLRSAVELGTGEPQSPDWYVVGRIAEQLGEPAAAREAYARVEKPETDDEWPTSTWALAKRRLDRMAKAGAPPRGSKG